MSGKRLSVDQAIAKAEAFAKRGQRAQAARIYRTVLEKYPGNRRAIRGMEAVRQAHPSAALGKDEVDRLIALYRQRRLPEALSLATDLVARVGDVPLILNILGAVQADLGQLDAAVESYTRALELEPGYAEAHSNLGNALNAIGRPEEAVASYRKALELKPEHVAALNNLGILLNDLGRPEEALDCLRQALALAPDFAEAHNSLGNALGALRRRGEAIDSYRQALKLRPDYAEAHNNLGGVFNALDRNLEALDCIRRALAIRPDFVEAHNSLGAVLAATGKPAEAIARYRRALELNPNDPKLYRNLSLVHRSEPGDPFIAELERELARHPPGAKGRELILEALGKAHDDAGNFEQAFGCYREANEAMATRAAFDPVAHRERMEEIRAMFPQPALCARGAGGEAAPLFVIGLPRAGKTLVESLLTQHPAVIGVGEGQELPEALRRLCDENGISSRFPACLKAFSPDEIAGLGAACLGELDRRWHKPGVRYYANTSPGNENYLGLIFRAFPSVKVIHCTREALDHCLSIYFKLFARGNEYSYDLQNLAAYYADVAGLMQHWRRLYGDRILSVDYESLVREPQEAGRRIYAHCGLAVPPGGLRADFRTSEIGRAGRYAEQLAPLRAALGL